MLKTLEKATLHRIAKDIDLWCKKSSDDLNRYMYVLGPFDGLSMDRPDFILSRSFFCFSWRGYVWFCPRVTIHKGIAIVFSLFKIH